MTRDEHLARADDYLTRAEVALENNKRVNVGSAANMLAMGQFLTSLAQSHALMALAKS